jgi:hypothetical protein
MRRFAPLIAVLVLAVVLRLVGVGHGFPRTEYVPDTHVVRAALGMAKDKDPFPPVGRYSTYPSLLPYVLLPVYAGQYALGRATGAWSGAGEYGQRLQLEPARAHRPARVVIALLGAGLAAAAFAALRGEGSPRRALLGAWLAATCLLAVHFAVQERPWAPLATFALLACWPAARYLDHGRPRSLMACAACAALAAASHQAGLPMLGLAGLAWLLGPLPWRAWRARLAHGVAAVAVFAFVALALGYNAQLVHGAPERAAIAGSELVAEGAAVGDLSIGGQAIVFDLRSASFVRLGRALLGYDPAIVALALVGLVAALRSRSGRVPTLFALGWLAFFTTNQNDHVRYLLPGVALLVVPAAFGAERLLAGGAAARMALALLLCLPLVQSGRLAWLLTRPDTRAVAEVLLAAAPPDGVVAIDRYGPVPAAHAASLERIAQWRSLGARESLAREAIAAGLVEDGAVDWVPLGDLFVFDERHRGWDFAPSRPAALADAVTADELLDRLGVTHVLLVDRDTSDDRPSLLVDPQPALPYERGPAAGRLAPKLAPLALAPAPAWTLGELGAEQRLPTELDFPLTNLWRCSQPGPRLALYERARAAR